MQLSGVGNNESDILGRVVEHDETTLAPEAARALLSLCFGEADRARVDDLAARARAGTLSAGERAEAEAYGRVGSLLGVLKSKARQSLRGRAADGAPTVH